MTKKKPNIEHEAEAFRALYHVHASALQTMMQSLQPTIEFLRPDPFPSNTLPTDEAIRTSFARPADSLSLSLTTLHEDMIQSPYSHTADGAQLANLQARMQKFAEIRSRYPASAWAPQFRLAIKAFDVWLENARVSKTALNADLVGKIKNEMHEIGRLCCLYSLHVAADRIKSMDQMAHAIQHRVESLEDLVNIPSTETTAMLFDVVERARRQLTTFAQSRRIIFRPISRKTGYDVPATMRLHDVERAVSNLLHNAVKYSHQLPNENAWITLAVGLSGDQSFVEVESWGVPIRREELEEELIFRKNYRGVHAIQAGREGTGSGLAYARDVARAHGGDVRVRSIPSITGRSPENYSQPFVTTVVFTIRVRKTG